MPNMPKTQPRSTRKARAPLPGTTPVPTSIIWSNPAEYLGAMLLTWANVHFYQDLMAAMRAAIAEGRFEAFRKDARRRFA